MGWRWKPFSISTVATVASKTEEKAKPKPKLATTPKSKTSWQDARDRMPEAKRKEMEAIEQQRGWDGDTQIAASKGRNKSPEEIDALRSFMTTYHVPPKCFMGNRNFISYYRDVKGWLPK